MWVFSMTNYRSVIFTTIAAVISSVAFSNAAMAAPAACVGVSQKCTKDKTYDKTIGGAIYSCYDCKQALCKGGGKGGLAGTKTTSVCTEKATTFTPLTDDDLANDAPDVLAPENDQSEAPGIMILPDGILSELVIIQTPKCSANSARLCANNGATCDIVGKNDAPSADVCRWAKAVSADACNQTAGIWTTPDSKYAKNHPNAVAAGSKGACLTEVANIRKKLADELTKGGAPVGYFNTWKAETKTTTPQDSKTPGLVAPSNLQVSDITNTTLTLSWTDNSDREFGVELYRMDPDAARRNQKGSRKFIGLFEERVDSNVKGTGRRSDQDYELEPDTNYCYRLRAYSGFDRSEVSGYSDITCAKTSE